MLMGLSQLPPTPPTPIVCVVLLALLGCCLLGTWIAVSLHCKLNKEICVRCVHDEACRRDDGWVGACAWLCVAEVGSVHPNTNARNANKHLGDLSHGEVESPRWSVSNGGNCVVVVHQSVNERVHNCKDVSNRKLVVRSIPGECQYGNVMPGVKQLRLSTANDDEEGVEKLSIFAPCKNVTPKEQSWVSIEHSIVRRANSLPNPVCHQIVQVRYQRTNKHAHRQEAQEGIPQKHDALQLAHASFWNNFWEENQHEDVQRDGHNRRNVNVLVVW
mmetsp:Transcript_7053/g.26444  ORF Transcript_7053/g.26444 Transcript_7053/m.26444 type:complete len:273 (+) Transcript_7053:701-1519(+)